MIPGLPDVATLFVKVTWSLDPLLPSVLLPAAKLYKPIWEYDRKTLAKDLGAHLVYGLATASAFRVLSASVGRES